MRRRGTVLAAAGLLGLAGLTGCSSASSPAASPNPSQGCPVTVADGWVKTADKGMTAAFGTLSNSSSEAVTITAASSPASSSMELHEVVDDNGQMVMQPVPGGFTVPASGSLTMEPGGYHLMLMDVSAPIEAGQDVTFTLTCADGASTEFTAQAKDYTGGEETYKNDGMDSMAPSPSMS